MEKVEVISTSHFTDTRIGGVSRKQRLFVPAYVAEELHSLGLVQYPNAQATPTNNPPTEALADGGGVLLASSPVAPALQPTTVMLFQGQDGPQLPSMTATEEPCLPMPSMPAMNNGGESMKKKLGRPSKASAGHKTNTLPEDSDSIE